MTFPRHHYTCAPYEREIRRQRRAEVRRQIVVWLVVFGGGLVFWAALFGVIDWLIRG